jgi:hypothetical protein
MLCRRSRLTMRHAFSFPAHIRDAVRAYVREAVAHVDPAGFKQEPAYTAALLARLAGLAYEGSDGSVVFRTTNVDSIGKGAAESWSGADLAITADIIKGDLRVTKAILAQAKLGGLEDLSSRERGRLVGQIQDMRRLTHSPKVILIRELDGRREPVVASGRRIAENSYTQGLQLPDYFVRRILTTFDGDTRPGFVTSVQESSLKQLRVFARVQVRQ